MSRNAITISGLKKRYRIGLRQNYPTIRDAIAHGAQVPARAVRRILGRSADDPNRWTWALDGIDMHVDEGEVVGIIGNNGAGKSTLLKILSGITEPTEGYADIRGRVGSLLEVGTGFHMELTGRENIYMNGALLGMKRAEINRKFDQIVEFSEVGKFLDTPVKRYSSGMYMRLAFAVAAHLEPDILIVDEVLAVGDAAFQKKCLGKMSSIAGEGRTVLFVSHNMTSVESLCSRAVMIDGGRLTADGKPRDIIGQYLQQASSVNEVSLRDRVDRVGDGSVKITGIRVESCDEDGIIRCSSRLRIAVSYESDRPITSPRITIDINDPTQVPMVMLDSLVDGDMPDTLPACGELTCVTAPLNLTAGRCVVGVFIDRGLVRADGLESVAEFDIEEEDYFGGGSMPSRDLAISLIRQDWSVA